MLANLFRAAEPDPNVLANIDGLCPLVHMEHGKPRTRGPLSLSLYSVGIMTILSCCGNTLSAVCGTTYTDTAHRERVLVAPFPNFLLPLPKFRAARIRRKAKSTICSSFPISQHQV